VLDAIADYLETLGIGSVGIDLFESLLPETPDDCVALFEYAGKPPLLSLDGSESDCPGLQVRVRASSYEAGGTKLEQIRSALHPVSNQSIGGIFFISIRVNGSPIPLGVDQNDRPERSLNFSIIKRR